MSMLVPKTMLLVVLVLVVVLSDFNVVARGETHVKVVNNLEGGLNLTLSCKYTVGASPPYSSVPPLRNNGLDGYRFARTLPPYITHTLHFLLVTRLASSGRVG